MELAIRRQLDIAGNIERFWDNVLKAGRDKHTRPYFTSRLALLESYWTRFTAGHENLLDYPALVDTSYSQESVYCRTEEAFVEQKARLLEVLSSDTKGKASKAVGGTESQQDVQRPRLPELKLPTFDGDRLRWEAFRDVFESVVHGAQTLAPIQKLEYLRSCLTGEAVELIEHLEVTDGGYELAWAALAARYNNRRVLVAAHMKRLITGAPMKTKSAREMNRLVSSTDQAIKSFKSLGCQVDQWDPWFVHLLVEKLDVTMRRKWEANQGTSEELPTYDSLREFILVEARSYEVAPLERVLPNSPITRRQTERRKGVAFHAAATEGRGEGTPCPLCRSLHGLRSCDKFRALTVAQRRIQVRSIGTCFNCLGSGHKARGCPSTSRCRICGGLHHSMLHEEQSGTTKPEGVTTTTQPVNHMGEEQGTTRITALMSSSTRTVLLATARLTLVGPGGRSMEVRALLDSGAESSFISEHAVQLLRLPRRRVHVTIHGVSGVRAGRASHSVSVNMNSHYLSTERITLKRVLVLPRLTTRTPNQRIPWGVWDHLRGLHLADPQFGRPADIDLILGADIYGLLFRGGVRPGRQGKPAAYETAFGWVLIGALSQVNASSQDGIAVHHSTTTPDLGERLRRFWELEEVLEEKPLSPEETECERLFADTHTRDQEGRYMVRLPRRNAEQVKLGDTRRGALRALESLERRLARHPSLRQRYRAFMDEYRELGHMEELTPLDRVGSAGCYLPHHAVVNPSNPKGKIRVVFNASFQSTSGVSLNDTLLPGPKLQEDLWVVLSRWRQWQYGFLADIVKMFRQIKVHPEDASLLRILWRASPEDEVQEFQMTTLTYGTACAPYLALRTLRQLATDQEARFPRGAEVVRSHMYVDDVLAGAPTLEEALEVREQTVGLLTAGGFQLGKWASPHPRLGCEAQESDCLIGVPNEVSALGVLWTPGEDSLRLRVGDRLASADAPTKRSVLSDIARLFDPAGWMAPVLVRAKILLQDLWRSRLEWDEQLPPLLEARWRKFAAELPELEGVAIPRWIGVSALHTMELHGFCDASERAYAAVVYAKGQGPSGKAITSLLVARTKVAPVRTTSVPRLELCGAVLVARLLKQVAQALSTPRDHLYAWTDARVVLAWLRDHPSRWSPFVAHRVATIQEFLPVERWGYVISEDNPADAATRGVGPADLQQLRRWWEGPPWLLGPLGSRPMKDPPLADEPLEERTTAATTRTRTWPANDVLLRFSTWTRLIRCTAYCCRFLRRSGERSIFLSTGELEASRLRWIRLVQNMEFSSELEALKRGEPVPRRSPLTALRPFLGPAGLIRVGGRLRHSLLPYGEKYPILLPRGNHLTVLLVRDAHQRTLHGGPQLTRSVLLRKYWIIQGNSVIRSVIHRCVRCARFRGQSLEQQMGQLPPDRVLVKRPFSTSGVDFAGPVSLRTTKGRGHKSYKGYIALFICMTTRAVHLEAVSDLQTAGFLAAFRRFVARRGHCARLISDNGTNFRGAHRELQTMLREAGESFQTIRDALAADGTEWKFIPPSAPHFGGLWEAGVKSTKHHLRRVIGDHRLTYEEMSTLLCQVEACLNSRPIHSMSTDGTDPVALTPGHFLIGEAPINVPEPSHLDTTTGSLLQRWRLTSKLRDHFWARWSREYLHHLQQMGKWRMQKENLQPGAVVLLKEDLLPPTKWPLARVTKVFPGDDGMVRVVEIRTATSTRVRPITRICPLPDLQ